MTVPPPGNNPRPGARPKGWVPFLPPQPAQPRALPVPCPPICSPVAPSGSKAAGQEPVALAVAAVGARRGEWLRWDSPCRLFPRGQGQLLWASVSPQDSAEDGNAAPALCGYPGYRLKGLEGT